MNREIFAASFEGTDRLIKKEDQVHFHGLDFFPVDTSYRFNASYVFIKDKLPVYLNKDSSMSDLYYPIVRMSFQVNNTIQQLTGFSKDPNEKKSLFIPFTDETSSVESYGGGRFLDVNFQINQQLILDFNLAYNPYCAYNSNYICPVPPSENRLTEKILAGEKIPLIDNH